MDISGTVCYNSPDGCTVTTRIGCQLRCGLSTRSSVEIRNLSMIHNVQLHMITEYPLYVLFAPTNTLAMAKIKVHKLKQLNNII